MTPAAMNRCARRDGREAARLTPARSRPVLDPKTLPLPPDGTSETLELRLDRVIDRFARPSEVIRDVLANGVAWDGIPHLLTTMRCPSRSRDSETGSIPAGPVRTATHAANYWRNRPPTRWAAPKYVRQSRADREADQRRGQ